MNQKFAPNFTTVPNIILDEWMPLLSAPEFKIVILIARKTYGWHKDCDDISTGQIAKLTDLGRTTVVNAVNRMESAGYLTCITHPNEKGKTTPPNTYQLNLDFGLNTPSPYPADVHPPIHLRDSPYTSAVHPPIPEMDTQKKPLQKKPMKEKERKEENAVLSMEVDANAQAVASFSSHSDLVEEEEIPEQTAEAEQKPSKGRKSVTPDTRKRMEGLAKRFYEVHPKKGFFDLNAEITKYHDELAWAVGRALTPDLLETATRNALARLKPPFQVTLKVVMGEVESFLAAPPEMRDLSVTEFHEQTPRKMTNAERFRQMAENGGMPEL